MFRILGCVLLLTAGLATLVPGGQAHAGQACGLDGDRLEGECFDTATNPSACDPNAEGEHTRVKATPGASVPVSQDKVAQMMSEGCGILFEDVALPHGVDELEIHYILPNNIALTATVTVTVDGIERARIHHSQDGKDWRLVKLDISEIPAGEHNIKIELAEASPSWSNLWIDYVDMPPAQCINRPPAVPAILGGDGMGAGDYGWAGFGYSFDATVRGAADPDGDPVTYTWSLGDGSTAPGLTTGHTYATTGDYRLQITATDDPSARCPEASPRTVTSGAYVFHVVQDWRTELLRPQDGTHCVADETVSGPGPSVIAGWCEVEAAVTIHESPAFLVDQVCFRSDGDAFDCDPTAGYTGFYDGTEDSIGFHGLDACASAVADKHHRLFCSQEHTFLNALGLGF